MKIYKLVCALIVLFSALNSRAECPTIDLVSQPPLANRENIFQADVSWCCSYAFVDGLSLKFNKNYSPIDIAISKMKMSQTLEGCTQLSQIPDAINQSSGLCAEDEFEKAVYNDAELGRILAEIPTGPVKAADSAEFNTNANLPNLAEILAKGKYKNRLENLEQLRQSLLRSDKWENDCRDETPYDTKIFKNINSIKDLAQIARLNLEKTFFDYMYDLSQKNCKNRNKVKLEYEKIELNRFGKSDESKLRNPEKEIIELLRAKKSPVFGISEDILFNIKQSFSGKLGSLLKGNHAVNVVGSRPVGDKCYLKVRDSSNGGPACQATKRNKNILCNDTSETANKMTYEIEIETFLSAARQGLVLK